MGYTLSHPMKHWLSPHSNAVRARHFLFTGCPCSRRSVGSLFGGINRANFYQNLPCPSEMLVELSQPFTGGAYPSFPVPIGCCAGLPTQGDEIRNRASVGLPKGSTRPMLCELVLSND